MTFDWPNTSASRLGGDVLPFSHSLHASPLFDDAGLADLLDRYPRDRLGVYRFPPHAEGRVQAVHGRATDVAGKDLLEAVRAGQIWLNMRKANTHLPAYQEIADALRQSVQGRFGQTTSKWDIGVLISSPNIHVHYHLDASPVALIQIRGRKRAWIYPPRPPYLSAEQVEAMMMREREEDLEFRTDFDAQAAVLDLEPGKAVTWPQFAPHRVQNGDMLNVSLSCEYATLETTLRANAIYANANLRRLLGLSPPMPDRIAPSVLLRAALSRGIKLVRRPPTHSPTPITFRIDPESRTIIDLGSQ